MKKKSKAPKAKTAKAEPRDVATIVTKIKRTFRDDICNIIGRGELLQRAKDQIEHDGWLTWLETNFNWDESSSKISDSRGGFEKAKSGNSGGRPRQRNNDTCASTTDALG
jgi:hypothetical protein